MSVRAHDWAVLRISIRVKPGSSRNRVGGRYGAQEAPELVVAVQARAVEGAANRAVLSLVAVAFGVRNRDVVLVAGDRSRTKVLDVLGDADVLRTRWLALLAAP